MEEAGEAVGVSRMYGEYRADERDGWWETKEVEMEGVIEEERGEEEGEESAVKEEDEGVNGASEESAFPVVAYSENTSECFIFSALASGLLNASSSVLGSVSLPFSFPSEICSFCSFACSVAFIWQTSSVSPSPFASVLSFCSICISLPSFLFTGTFTT